MENLVAAYMPLLAKEVRTALSRTGSGADGDIEDAWQGAFLGLLEAIVRFDPTRGSSLGSFARSYVIGGIWDAIKGIAQFDVDPLDENISHTPEDSWFADGKGPESMSLGAVGDFIAALPPRQQQVVRLMYESNLSQAEVARTLGVSRTAVSKLHAKVIERGRFDTDLAVLVMMRRVA
jgi:RNA polymerase sigma factor (sigma-70 family)